MTTIRREMPAPQLDKAEFKRRYRARFYDPAFESMQVEIDRLADIAWGAYEMGGSRRARSRPEKGLPIPIISSPSNGARPANAWRMRSGAKATPASRPTSC